MAGTRTAPGKTGKVQPIRAAPVHPFDRTYGTDTGGLIPGVALHTGHANDAHVTAYYAVAPSILDGLIDLWQQRQPRLPIDRYTFVDVGAGKGRAMLAASLHPFGAVVGIESNPGLAEVARANTVRFRASDRAQPLAPVELREGDALEVALPDAPLLVFLFHPFEAPVLRSFSARLVQAFADRPGLCDLMYVNAEHTSLLDRDPAFTRLFHGLVPMSAEDHAADLAEIAGQQEYGSTGDELCTLYRLTGRARHK